MSAIAVYYETRSVGSIEVGLDGPSFVYDPQWLRTRGAFQISILMPLSPGPVKPEVFLPWAANLLPEGSQLRTIAAKLGAAAEDVIGILSKIGRDTAGALSIGKPGSANPGNWRPVLRKSDLERIIDELPSKPFLAGEDGVSMSLAGVQSKLGVALDDRGRICIPLEGSPSTHILKPDADRLFGGVQNEALCLTLARCCGLDAPAVTTGRAGQRTYLLVTRYDRIQQGEHWRRLHQEDFCQALGKPPSAKYEANQTGIRGPTLADMFKLTRKVMGAADILALLDTVIFNVIVCNTDAHAKNYSLMISGKGFKLAPIYDVMCAAAWDGVTQNLAQKIAGKNRGQHLKRRHWETFARECGLNPTRLVARVEGLVSAALKYLPDAVAEVDAMPAGTHALVPVFRNAIESRAHALLLELLVPDLQTSAATNAVKKPKSAKARAKSEASPKRRRTKAERL